MDVEQRLSDLEGRVAKLAEEVESANAIGRTISGDMGELIKGQKTLAGQVTAFLRQFKGKSK